MVLPLYLALTREEMETSPPLPAAWGWMLCPFSPTEPLPEALPPGSMLVLTDRIPCRDPGELLEAVGRLNCGSVLLDFERKPEADALAIANALFQALPCPVAAPPGFIEDSGSCVFLPPCPLHVPLTEYLRPWQGREIWLEAAIQRKTITVTPGGSLYGPVTPADRLNGGFFDDVLQCRCLTEISETEARFTLFDTPDTLAGKLDLAAALGVSRAVGLYQELGRSFPGCFFPSSALE